MWTRPILSAVVALAVAGTPLCAETFKRPFVTMPTPIALQAMALADGEDVPASREPEVTAAILALLLVSELGVAEAYEAAVEGGDDDDVGDGVADPYTRAHALMQTVHRLVDALPGARDSADVQDLVARLDALMPTAARPARLDADPEAAEVIAQALVGVLERETGAELYPGRDLATALQTIAQMSGDACGGRVSDHTVDELITASAFYFEETLEAPLSVMMPEVAETIEEAFDLMADARGTDPDACLRLSVAFGDVAQLFPGVGQ